MPGPHEQRLIRALTGAKPGRVRGHGGDWELASRMLEGIAREIAGMQLPVRDGEAGALTARAMNDAFRKSAEAMSHRAEQLKLGRYALDDSSEAMRDAMDAWAALGDEEGPPTYTPHEDPASEAGIQHEKKFQADLDAFQAKAAHREEVARQQNEKLDKTFRESTETMKKIHGQPDPEPETTSYPGGAAGAGGGGAAPGAGVAGSTGGRNPNGTLVGTVGQPGDDYAPVAGELITGGGVAGGVGAVPAAVGGTSDGGGFPLGGVGLGVAGIAGGTAAGLIGAKLVNALRGGGGLLGGSPGSAGSAGLAGRGTAAAGVRGIGASGRAGGAGTIGRGAASAGAGVAGRGAGSAGRGVGAGAGAAGRSGASGRTGGRAGGAGRGGAAGAGAGAAGRGGRGKDDEKAKQGEHYEIDGEWVGDEEAAPGILD